MVDHSVIQQHTAWWLLGQTSTTDANLKASGPGAGEGGSGRPSGRMELPQSGGSGGGALGKLALPGFPGGKVGWIESFKKAATSLVVQMGLQIVRLSSVEFHASFR